MRTVMLVGKTGCGKSTFCRALFGLEDKEKKTQAIEIVNSAMDTPGEYLENPRFYRALLTSSAEVEAVLFMQDCTQEANLFPPAFASMFSGKTVLGIISKTDLGTEEQIARAEAFLRQAGAVTSFRISGRTGEGIAAVITYLTS